MGRYNEDIEKQKDIRIRIIKISGKVSTGKKLIFCIIIVYLADWMKFLLKNLKMIESVSFWV